MATKWVYMFKEGFAKKIRSFVENGREPYTESDYYNCRKEKDAESQSWRNPAA